MTRPATWRAWAARGALLLAVSAILLGLLVQSVGVARLRDAYAAASWTWIAVALAAYALEFLLRWARWLLLFRAAPPGAALAIWAVGAGVNEVLPTGAGEVARGVVGWQRYGVAPARVLSPTGIERLFDLVLLLGFGAAALGAMLLPVSGLTVALPAAAALVGLALLARPRLLAGAAERVPGRGALAARVRTFLTAVAHDLGQRRVGGLLLVFLVSAAVWVAEGCVQWAGLRALGVDLDVPLVVALTGLAYLVGFVSFLPGGLGSREVALAQLLAVAGAAYAPAVAAAIAVRAGQTLLTLVVAGVGVAAVAARPRRAPTAAPSLVGADET